jgi:hypothetical protein
MTTDREYLEWAAKAAGHEVVREACEIMAGVEGVMLRGVQRPWSPLTDDGDALRLAVKLRMCVDAWGSSAAAVVSINNRAMIAEPHYGDAPERATRRAIVRAAAEIGKGMP